MPHFSNFKLNGKVIPSVNECTDALSKEGLYRNFFRKLGFKEADKQSKDAKKKGDNLAKAMELFRIDGTKHKTDGYINRCLDNWYKWYAQSPCHIGADDWIEPHLINTIVGYHGSPDVVLEEPEIILGDDKVKKRFADYRLLMNEHAYAMCDSYRDKLTNEIRRVPWAIPIKTIWFWTYDPDSGTLFSEKHSFEEQVYRDFLTCHAMQRINQRAEAYFHQNAVLLPTQTEKLCKTKSQPAKV
jgi:hypothetical protein